MPVHGGFGALGDGGRCAVGVNADDARGGEDFAVGVTGFGDVGTVLFVEGDAGGEVEAGGDGLDAVTGGERDVGGVDLAGRRGALSTSGGAAHREAAGEGQECDEEGGAGGGHWILARHF